MALNIKPKSFGPVHVRFDGAQGVTFAQGDDAADQPHPPHSTPVATLLASVGHCLVESIRIVAKREELALSPFTISVTAEKALDLPGRLKTVRCTVHGPVVDDATAAKSLVVEAKGMCTVSNTLNCDISVVSANGA